MKLLEQTRIYHPNDWGEHSIFTAFSLDGQLIAVRVPSTPYDNGQKRHNIFVYDINGNKKWSNHSVDGGTSSEIGIAFYPDKYHLLAPGADDNYGNLDGLKQYTIGGQGYTLPFSNTALSGINTSIYAVSDKGDAILGRKSGSGTRSALYCIVDNKQLVVNGSSPYQAYFSPDSEYLLCSSTTDEYWLYKLTEIDKKIDISGDFICFLPNKQLMTSFADSFVVWDTQNWQVVREVKCNLPQSALSSSASTNNGDFFALCHWSGGISLWETENFTLLHTINLPPDQRIARMKFSSDNQYLLTVIMDGQFRRKEIVIWKVI